MLHFWHYTITKKVPSSDIRGFIMEITKRVKMHKTFLSWKLLPLVLIVSNRAANLLLVKKIIKAVTFYTLLSVQLLNIYFFSKSSSFQTVFRGLMSDIGGRSKRDCQSVLSSYVLYTSFIAISNTNFQNQFCNTSFR